MLNWVAIYRRLLRVYNVHTQQELGMALGIPFSFGLEGEAKNEPIPWPILEMVVMHKHLSWDWLLTGKFYRTESGFPAASAAITGGRATGRQTDQDDPLPSAPQPQQIDESRTERTPRIETRELMRRLLAVEKNQDEHEAKRMMAAPEQPPAEAEESVRERSWPSIEAAPPPPEEAPSGAGPPGPPGSAGPPAANQPPADQSAPANGRVNGGGNSGDAKKSATVVMRAPLIPADALASNAPAQPAAPTSNGSARMLAELEDLKTAMESELMKVDKILRGRRMK